MIHALTEEPCQRFGVAERLAAPIAGYVGYGEGGKLTEAVRRRPSAVILLDEVEKAHPDVFNVLLQIMEDGRLTDSQARSSRCHSGLSTMCTRPCAPLSKATGAAAGPAKSQDMLIN